MKMADYTRGDDPIYDGFREGWKCPCDAKEGSEELWEIVGDIPLDHLQEICEAEHGGRCVVLDEEMVIRVVEKAILVNSDEKKYRYELGKDCLIPCCKDAYKYLIAEREEGAEHE